MSGDPFIQVALANTAELNAEGRALAEDVLSRVRSGELTPEDIMRELEHAARSAWGHSDTLRGLAYALYAVLQRGKEGDDDAGG